MIDLGELVAKVVVDSDEGTSKLEQFGKAAESAEAKSFNLTGKLKGLAAGFAIGAAIKVTADALGKCVKAADEFNSAANTLQAQTGATEEEMAGLEDTLKNIYANNYGEDFEDIASAMAEVKSQTGLLGDELQSTTESALAMRDTFGYEVQESTRAADMMMKQFGITSEEAFNLLAQGAQGGLDKNGNLLDSINEYSVHFQQLGFDAEEMFNMFSNGAATGVFDIDKLGDAVKEFGIRVVDGSDSTTEAFEMLGLNAEEMQNKFAQGGDAAQAAFEEVMATLSEVDSEVDKNTIGVNLFGTMWEDMGSAAVEALADTKGGISKTSSALNDIKKIKYDDMTSAFEGIGRQVETGLIIPIGEVLLPLINEFANWINEHMPEIQAVFEAVIGVISALIKGLAPVFEHAFKLITDVFNIFSAAFRGDWQGLLNGIKSFLTNALNAYVDIVTRCITKFRDAGKKMLTALWDGMKSVWNSLKSWLDSKVGAITNFISLGNSAKDGSHRNGLNEVPYDGYIAELHRGEMVLTQAEAKRYKNGGGSEGSVYNMTFAPVITVGSVRSDKDIKDISRALDQNIKDYQRAVGVV